MFTHRKLMFNVLKHMYTALELMFTGREYKIPSYKDTFLCAVLAAPLQRPRNVKRPLKMSSS